MTKKRRFTLAAILLALVSSPLLYAVEDCGTSVTECKLKQEIEELKGKVKKLEDAITSLRRKVSFLEEYQNVRTIVTKDKADEYCPNGSQAATVPLSYAGSTGNEICTANSREKKTCDAVLFVAVRNNNKFKRYKNKDISCQTRIIYPWPWGDVTPIPNTLSKDWSNGNSWVVCCKR